MLKQEGNACKHLSDRLNPCEMRLSVGLGGIDGIVQILTTDYFQRVCADETVACQRCAHYRLLTEYQKLAEESNANLA